MTRRRGHGRRGHGMEENQLLRRLVKTQNPPHKMLRGVSTRSEGFRCAGIQREDRIGVRSPGSKGWLDAPLSEGATTAQSDSEPKSCLENDASRLGGKRAATGATAMRMSEKQGPLDKPTQFLGAYINGTTQVSSALKGFWGVSNTRYPTPIFWPR